ncbi:MULTISPECIES: YvrJ family protein [Paenibacillus]|jgi:hypothetical protein|uniref:YvrJ-like protein n=1 Tax=Paenibacillus pabuli TaxID=1472 RepID=A0A855Y2G1_9BACL|nr:MULTISPECIES: YvrJ family protein [Paenibacillus]PWW44919.1 YvrJ-like protein [Paenibacillus pabuli]PXW11255.1 YvrJ-like protein [Paenibacillus taichungensis]QLG36717.1 YvrJ family protein [Paenibacillus sp. E222]RAI93677.1 YvrJ-like protein [Paenibacillus pabuli]SEM75090.1 YvrJ protein family protein [Paenibacillus sp. OK076]
MDNSAFATFIGGISQVGFPIMITLYLFTRFEKKLDQLSVNINTLIEVIKAVIKDESKQR